MTLSFLRHRDIPKTPLPTAGLAAAAPVPKLWMPGASTPRTEEALNALVSRAVRAYDDATAPGSDGQEGPLVEVSVTLVRRPAASTQPEALGAIGVARGVRPLAARGAPRPPRAPWDADTGALFCPALRADTPRSRQRAPTRSRRARTRPRRPPPGAVRPPNLVCQTTRSSRLRRAPTAGKGGLVNMYAPRSRERAPLLARPVAGRRTLVAARWAGEALLGLRGTHPPHLSY